VARTGKTGADAIFRAIQRICIVISHYRAKFDAVITAAEGAGAITADQATVIRDFIGSLNVLCTALNALANYSGF
jgi:hypothetical protein